jgi:hypothetical protein
MRPNDEIIRVYRSWDGWQNAEVRVGHIKRVHWLQPDRAPHHLLHGFVSCADLISGQIPHECDGASAPHDLLVCVLKRHVVPTTYEELVRRADAGRASVPLATGAAPSQTRIAPAAMA